MTLSSRLFEGDTVLEAANQQTAKRFIWTKTADEIRAGVCDFVGGSQTHEIRALHPPRMNQ